MFVKKNFIPHYIVKKTNRIKMYKYLLEMFKFLIAVVFLTVYLIGNKYRERTSPMLMERELDTLRSQHWVNCITTK